MSMDGFRNEHISFSRLSRYETCPLSFRMHYIEKRAAEPGVALQFGKALHWVLENLIREHSHAEQIGTLSEDRALKLLRTAWAEHALSGIQLFQEAVDIVKEFVREEGIVDHRDVLAVEKEFRLSIGKFTVLGYIDRVNAIDDETIEIVDYKSNRQLFSREEVDSSLQMSLYQLAAQQMWPWAKRFKLTFHMLRHGIRMGTTRTDEQLKVAREYVLALGTATEMASEYPARLNPNCIYCDHRSDCPAYAEALKGKRTIIAKDLGDLEAVSSEREEVARLMKILGARKDELEGILKSRLTDTEELVLTGVRYRMFTTESVNYPFEKTLSVLERAIGIGREDLMGRLAAIDKKGLDSLFKHIEKGTDRSRVALLKAELKAISDVTHSRRLWAKEIG